MKERMGYVSKDRDTESLCLTASIQDNIAIGGLEQFAARKFLLFPGREKTYVDRQIEALSVKCAGREQQVSQLSGGNKQKVVFGKWIGRDSQILILDCPTRGVDIGVKRAHVSADDRAEEAGEIHRHDFRGAAGADRNERQTDDPEGRPSQSHL